MIAEVTTDTELFPEPDDLSPSNGKIPAGTLLRLLGKRSGAYENVSVELENGVAEGWVLRKAMNLAKQERQQEKMDARAASGQTTSTRGGPGDEGKEGRPRYIPKDEGSLIRRDPSFLYGFVVELPYVMITDSSNNYFTGVGYRLGAHIGKYLATSLPLRLEVAYTKFPTTADSQSPAGAGASLELGFVDFRLQMDYEFSVLTVFGILQYSLGAGVGKVSNTVQFGDVSTLNSLWFGAGAGYRIRFGDYNSFQLQGAYTQSLSTSPFQYQALSARVLLEFRG